MNNANQNKIIATNIKKYLKANNMTQKKLAEKIGISASTMSDYMNLRAKPSHGVLQKIADVFNVGKSDIDTTYKNSDESNGIQTNNDFVILPMYGSVSAGVLSEIEGISTDSMNYISFPTAIFSRPYDAAKLFAMKVNGNSMDKIIQHGELIVARKQDFSNYSDGDIVIFSHDGEYSLKRYCPNEVEGAVLFKSESHNPVFKDIVVMKDTKYNLNIYGKVIYFGTTL